MKLIAENLLIEPSISGGAVVRFETLDLKYNHDLMHKYDGKKMTVEIKEKRAGRSLDANAYCWVLCDKIATTKGILMKKTDVYRQAIKDYGVTLVMPVKNDLLGNIIKWHEKGGLGNSCDVLGPCKVQGYTNVMFYYGSSGYDTKQMSILIDGLVADAKELGIDTMPPAEVERLKAMWGETA